ncbi:hypothetical protein COJ93_26315 [Bacillus anthracis]|nr:hypothetical protein COJ93_26315 [Bacillus anthracis]
MGLSVARSIEIMRFDYIKKNCIEPNQITMHIDDYHKLLDDHGIRCDAIVLRGVEELEFLGMRIELDSEVRQTSVEYIDGIK